LTLHSYYILHWKKENTFWVDAIRQWSVESSFRLRMEKHGFTVGVINWCGTFFDIFVHLFMVGQLLQM
jgi:hypothetical protein